MGARITSDGGLLAYRELDDAFGLTAMGASALGEGRRGRNIRRHLPGLLRQAVYGRLAGYEDVNDAERLARDAVMRAIVGREGMDRPAASTGQMGRLETEWLASEANLAVLTWAIAECRVWPHVVVVLAPGLDDVPCLGERAEPVLIEALVAAAGEGLRHRRRRTSSKGRGRLGLQRPVARSDAAIRGRWFSLRT
jgi:Transposase DDE domain group 1